MPDDHMVRVRLDFDARAFTESIVKFRRSMENIAAKMQPLFHIRLRLVVDDPSDWRPESLKGWIFQARAIMLHEFWSAADSPQKSPGARWVRR